MELSLYVVERGADLRKLDTVATTNRGQDMRLDDVDEGQILPLRIVQVDQRPGPLRLSSYWIPPAHHPTAQRSFRHAQVHGIAPRQRRYPVAAANQNLVLAPSGRVDLYADLFILF